MKTLLVVVLVMFGAVAFAGEPGENGERPITFTVQGDERGGVVRASRSITAEKEYVSAMYDAAEVHCESYGRGLLLDFEHLWISFDDRAVLFYCE